MKRLLFAVLLLLFALFAVIPVMAQEATETSPPVDDGEVVTVPIDYLWSVENRSNAALVIFGVVVTFISGGGILAVTVVSKDAAEKLYMSAPPQHQTIIQGVITALASFNEHLTNFIKLMREVTDGKPNDAPGGSGSG